MVYQTPHQWYFHPLTMVHQALYRWYFEPPIHGILNPLFWYYGLNLWFNLPWWGSKYYDRNLAQWSIYHMVYWPPGWFFRGSKYHMTPVFSVGCVARCLILFLFVGRLLLYPFAIFFLLAIVLSIIRFMTPLIFSNCSYLLHVVLFLCSEWFFLIIAKTRTWCVSRIIVIVYL